jgi:hypothetical protein
VEKYLKVVGLHCHNIFVIVMRGPEDAFLCDIDTYNMVCLGGCVVYNNSEPCERNCVV